MDRLVDTSMHTYTPGCASKRVASLERIESRFIYGQVQRRQGQQEGGNAIVCIFDGLLIVFFGSLFAAAAGHESCLA